MYALLSARPASLQIAFVQPRLVGYAAREATRFHKEPAARRIVPHVDRIDVISRA